MTFEAINVSLDEGSVASFIRRYHFNEDDKSEILKIYRQISPRVHAEFHYVLEDDMDGKKAIVVMTLGKAFDSYQESIIRSGDIQKAYVIECIGTELMSLAYNEIDQKLYADTGLYAGNYVFAGSDELPLKEIPTLMKKLGQTQITYNDAYVLIPKKSVVFTALLHEKRQNRHLDCSKCNSKNCAMRVEEYRSVKTEQKNKICEGLIHLYTGDGKGKTTASIGLAVRAAGAGKRVVFAQFMKGRDTSELNSLSQVSGIEIIRNNEDLGWFKKDDEEQAALFTKVHNDILDKIIARVRDEQCDVLIMDEATYPYNYGIIDKKKFEELIVAKPDNLEIVITGRNADDFIKDHADYITEMKKIRHPYDQGIQAREGIEY